MTLKYSHETVISTKTDILKDYGLTEAMVLINDYEEGFEEVLLEIT